MEPAERDCERIEAGTPPRSAETAAELARRVPRWRVGDSALEREIEFSRFATAMDLVNALARLAVVQDHDPRICVDYRMVELELTIRKMGGPSPNEFIMAAKIDRLVE